MSGMELDSSSLEILYNSTFYKNDKMYNWYK